MEVYKKKYTPEEKLQQALRLYYSTRELKKAALREFYPEWSQNKIEEKVREFFLHARS